MEKDINKLLEEGVEIGKIIESTRNELIKDKNTPLELKRVLIQCKDRFTQEEIEYKNYIEQNKHRKIIGYDPQTFIPIFED